MPEQNVDAHTKEKGQKDVTVIINKWLCILFIAHQRNVDKKTVLYQIVKNT